MSLRHWMFKAWNPLYVSDVFALLSLMSLLMLKEYGPSTRMTSEEQAIVEGMSSFRILLADLTCFVLSC